MKTQTTRIVLETKYLVPIPKAAEIIGIHFTTLYRWIKNQRLHTIRIGHQDFLETSVVAKLKEQNKTAIAKK